MDDVLKDGEAIVKALPTERFGAAPKLAQGNARYRQPSYGFYDYYYEYDVYRFSLRERTYTPRVYADQPKRALYIGCEESGRSRLFNVNCSSDPLLIDAGAYLRSVGITSFDRLSIVGSYVPLDMAEVSPQTLDTNEVSQELYLHPIDALRDLAIGTPVPTASTSDHDDLYDEHGIPK